MTNPILADKRPCGAHFRTSEVIKVPLQWLLSRPRSRNPHDDLTDDALCDVCNSGGNIKNVDPHNIGDGPLHEAPETGRSYLWRFQDLETNHRCPMCRLIWRTFRPF